MTNIISYIAKLLTKGNKDKAGPVAGHLMMILVKGQHEIIGAPNRSGCNGGYNKANLWIAFNRLDRDNAPAESIHGEYSFTHYNLIATGFLVDFQIN